MNALRYNLIFYDKSIVISFIEALKHSRGKNISQVLYAYILHDRDVIEETGELKKEHYHLWLEFPSSVKDRDLINLLEACGSNASALSHQKTDRNFLAYLTHNTINSTLKKQYDLKDIVTNIQEDLFYEWYYEALSKTNKPTRQQQKIKETSDFIMRLNDYMTNSREIKSQFDLINTLIANQEYDLLDFVSRKAYFINATYKEAFEINKRYTYSHEIDSEEMEALGYEKHSC